MGSTFINVSSGEIDLWNIFSYGFEVPCKDLSYVCSVVFSDGKQMQNVCFAVAYV